MDLLGQYTPLSSLKMPEANYVRLKLMFLDFPWTWFIRVDFKKNWKLLLLFGELGSIDIYI